MDILSDGWIEREIDAGVSYDVVSLRCDEVAFYINGAYVGMLDDVEAVFEPSGALIAFHIYGRDGTRRRLLETVTGDALRDHPYWRGTAQGLEADCRLRVEETWRAELMQR